MVLAELIAKQLLLAAGPAATMAATAVALFMLLILSAENIITNRDRVIRWRQAIFVFISTFLEKNRLLQKTKTMKPPELTLS